MLKDAAVGHMQRVQDRIAGKVDRQVSFEYHVEGTAKAVVAHPVGNHETMLFEELHLILAQVVVVLDGVGVERIGESYRSFLLIGAHRMQGLQLLITHAFIGL